MAIEVITEFVAGATIRVIAYIYDDDDDLVNVGTSINTTIIDAAGTTGATASTMSQAATGVYEYYHTTSTASEKGYWRGQIDVVDGTKTSIAKYGFKVK